MTAIVRVLILAALLIPSMASAQAVTDIVTWTLPTQYEDGSALPAADITEVRVYVASVAGGPYALATTLAGTATTVSLARQTPMGLRCYVATVVASGFESAYSNEACKLVKRPKAPAITQIR